MALYMLADGLPDGVVARVMGWTIERVTALRKRTARIRTPAQNRRDAIAARRRNAAKLARLWEEKRA